MTDQDRILTPVTVTVDVDALIKSRGYNAKGYDDYTDETYGGTGLDLLVADRIAERLATSMRDEVKNLVKDVALGKVDAIIDEVINGDIQLTNGYGERTGAKTTLREKIVSAVNDQLTRKVSRNGSSDPYGRDGISYVQFVANEAAKRALSTELKVAADQAVADVKATVTKLVTEEIGRKVVTTVTRGM